MLKNLVDRASMVFAVAGFDGALEIADRANYVYARRGGADGERIEVHTSTIRPNYDDALYVVLENPAVPRSWRMVFWLRDGEDSALPPPVRGTPFVQELLADSEGELLVDADGALLRE